MEEEQAEVLKIMIQNSMMLGQDVSGGGSSARSWRTSQQKKIINKMEILENKI